MAVSLSLILPARNEEAVIEQAVREAHCAMDRLGYRGEILVVDDGSTDATAAIVESLAASFPSVRLLCHKNNQGYGAALKTGFVAAKSDLVAFTDADCQFHLEDLNRLVPLTEQHPIATGWREDRKDSGYRIVLSRGFNTLVDGLLGIGVKDVDCALKVFRKEALGQILPDSSGFFANTEMLVKARQQGLSVAEAGVRHRPRAGGESKVSLWAIPRVLARLLPFWWSQVLHRPITAKEKTQEGHASPHPLSMAGLTAVLVLSLGVFGLGQDAPLMEPTEARNAQIAQEMLASGEWVVPQLEGKAYLDKPPLLYWMLMGLFEGCGDTDRVARLAPMIWCSGMVAGVWFWVSRELGSKAGFLSSVALAFCLPFVHYGRLLAMDGLLGFCSLMAVILAFEATRPNRVQWGWWLGSATFLALAALTKGPIAFVLFLGPLTPLALVDERWRKPGRSGWLAHLLIAIAPLAIWAALVEKVHTGFIADFLYTHHFTRFTDPIDHEEPFWFYLPMVTLFALPWSLGLADLARGYWESPRVRRSSVSALAGTAAVHFAVGLLFFSAAGCKRPSYLVPLFPYLAILGGIFLDRLTEQAGDLGALWELKDRRSGLFTGGALAAGTLFVVVALAKQMIPPGAAILMGTVFGSGAILAFFGPSLWQRRLSWGHALSASAAVVIAGVAYLLPGYNEQFSIKSSIESLDGDETTNRLVICYPQRYYSTSFYTPEALVKVYGPGEHVQLFQAMAASPGAILLLKSGNAWKNLEKDAPPGWQWQSSTVPGHFRAMMRQETTAGQLAQLGKR